MKELTKLAAAVELGRLGGLKGGPARALKLSAKRRKQIARNAANARWAKVSEVENEEQDDYQENGNRTQWKRR